ncbi:MAG: tRNA (adenosine(37)-N6)-threonylcarbamoyltransferase complex ATPase subunit type 1 TsaE [Actinomycetales bacterium]
MTHADHDGGEVSGGAVLGPARDGITVRRAHAEDAAALAELIVRSFAARPVLDPPSTATDETAETVGAALLAGGGVVAELDGRLVAGLLVAHEADVVTLRRVATDPDFRQHGVASRMVRFAEDHAAELGARVVALAARVELPGTVRFWQRHGYVQTGRRGQLLDLVKPAPRRLLLPTPDATRALGAALARLLRAGDLVILDGSLGAGKTTLTQGLGEALGVAGVSSPTFVVARTHRRAAAPDLVHVDAYRLGGALEVDDLDLDTDLPEAITVVEWGTGKVEGLSEDQLHVTLDREVGGGDGEARLAVLRPQGHGWLQRVDQLVHALQPLHVQSLDVSESRPSSASLRD